MCCRGRDWKDFHNDRPDHIFHRRTCKFKTALSNSTHLEFEKCTNANYSRYMLPAWQSPYSFSKHQQMLATICTYLSTLLMCFNWFYRNSFMMPRLRLGKRMYLRLHLPFLRHIFCSRLCLYYCGPVLLILLQMGFQYTSLFTQVWPIWNTSVDTSILAGY